MYTTQTTLKRRSISDDTSSLGYPALTQSNFDSYIENSIQSQDPFFKSEYVEKIFEGPNNFENYVRAAKATKIIVDEQGNIHRGGTYWSQVSFDGFVLPAQGRSKPYCKKWVSWGCNNTRQHPGGKHYAEHEQKTCKIAYCPLCFVSWINRQANRSTRRLVKFTKNKKFHFRHIVLSPPQERAKTMTYKELKKWLAFACKIANIKTCAIVFHPFRFQDRERVQPYVSPHFHLLVYDKITNTIEFHKKTRDRDGNSWFIKNKGDMKTDVDIFNCVRYLLSHAGVRTKTHVIRYLGDISYRKLKVEKESLNHRCPYCDLPLRIFFIKKIENHKPPPIDFIGLWDPKYFSPVDTIDKDTKIPFYSLKEKSKIEYKEELIFSFEELLSIKTSSCEILDRIIEMRELKFKTSIKCMSLEEFN